MGKLVRDRIPDLIRAEGRVPDMRVLRDDEYCGALHAKLGEEAAELAAATGAQIVDELADVIEVVRAIARVNGIDPADVERAVERKRAGRGGFDDRVYLESW